MPRALGVQSLSPPRDFLYTTHTHTHTHTVVSESHLPTLKVTMVIRREQGMGEFFKTVEHYTDRSC